MISCAMLGLSSSVRLRNLSFLDNRSRFCSFCSCKTGMPERDNCWLKSSIPNSQTNPQTISGAKPLLQANRCVASLVESFDRLMQLMALDARRVGRCRRSTPEQTALQSLGRSRTCHLITPQAFTSSLTTPSLRCLPMGAGSVLPPESIRPLPTADSQRCLLKDTMMCASWPWMFGSYA